MKKTIIMVALIFVVVTAIVTVVYQAHLSKQLVIEYESKIETLTNEYESKIENLIGEHKDELEHVNYLHKAKTDAYLYLLERDDYDNLNTNISL